MAIRLSVNLSWTYPKARLSLRIKTNDRIFHQDSIYAIFTLNCSRPSRPSSRDGVLLEREKPLLCKLFEHCAFAQRSEASKRCPESQNASEIMNFMSFWIFIILGPPKAKMWAGISGIHNALIGVRLSGNLSWTYPKARLSLRIEMNDRIFHQDSICLRFFF